jgi:NADH:ubiquinone oxidoreductase subunit E
MSRVPGAGMAKGMALTLRRFFQPKVTVQYPEQAPSIPPRHRGRLQLLYDEYGTLKCETCFQCAQACPIECIDMGGTNTRDRFWVHWGPAEQYAERREESALRRSGRPVPDAALVSFEPIDLAPLDAILEEEDHDPRRMARILDRTQAAYGRLPVSALQHVSHSTGAWYSEVYGTASMLGHLRFEAPASRTVGVCRCPSCAVAGAGAIRDAFEAVLGIPLGATTPDGRVALAAVDCHGESPGSSFVSVDGEPRLGLDAAGAAALARWLTGGSERAERGT